MGGRLQNTGLAEIIRSISVDDLQQKKNKAESKRFIDYSFICNHLVAEVISASDTLEASEKSSKAFPATSITH